MTAKINGIEVNVGKAQSGRWGCEVTTKDGIVIGWGADAQDALIDAKKNITTYEMKVN